MKLEMNDPRFAANEIVVEVVGSQANITLPNAPGVIPVAIEDGALQLFPQRAAAHKRLLAAMGEPT